MSDIVRYCQILSDIVRYFGFVGFCRICRILPDFVRFCQILSDLSDLSAFVRFCQILSDFSDFVRFCQILSDLSDSVRFFQILSDDTSFLGLASIPYECRLMFYGLDQVSSPSECINPDVLV